MASSNNLSRSIPCLFGVWLALAGPCATAAAGGSAGESPGAAQAILHQMLEQDPWALAGAAQVSHAVVKSPSGSTQRLQFTVRSRVYRQGLSKLIVRFSRPGSLAGAGILVVQHAEGDDERFLFLPEQKHARRIPVGSRSQTFMGMDFTFADLDRRDLREGFVTLIGEEKVGDVPCTHLSVVPQTGPYSRVEVWVSKDNLLPLRWKMFDPGGQLIKTFEAEEVRRVSDRWYVTRSKMMNVQERHSTELVLDRVSPDEDISDDEFSVRELEKL